MSFNSLAPFRPKFGGLFTAAANTSPLTALAQFTPAGAGPTGWTNHGHLSRSSLPSRSADGGDALSLDTWQVVGLLSEPGDTTLSYEYTLLQMDAPTISELSALHGQNVALLELWFSGAKRFAKWVPNAKAAWTQDPMAEGVDDWANMKFTLTVQAPGETLNLASLADPEGGSAVYPSPANPVMLLIDDTAFTAA
ncbi:MAG: hypothetical protein LBK42_10360 [Propionibacteriaceae bacterium]|jgi:hypothetical protein|nr:hypothetical protein [Propionibacteriaceae bacterium]